jgi:hypothetical protein
MVSTTIMQCMPVLPPGGDSRRLASRMAGSIRSRQIAMNCDPRDAELLAWLAGLPTETEFLMRCALMTALPSFRRNGDFKRHRSTTNEAQR